MDTEQDYLDAMEQLKKKYEEIETKERMFKKVMKTMRMDMCATFGLVKSIDSMMDNVELPDDYITLWEVLASQVYTMTNNHVLLIEPNPRTIELTLPAEVLNIIDLSNQSSSPPANE